MKKTALLLLLFLVALPIVAADAPKECSLCVGLTGPAPSTDVFSLIRAAEGELPTLTVSNAGRTTLIVDWAIAPGSDPLLQVESHTQAIIEWARAHGPFAAIGVRVEGADPAVAAYAVKRLAVSAQGLDVARQIALPAPAELDAMFANGAQPYFDVVIADGPAVAGTLASLAERDPSKKIHAVVDSQSANPLYDAANALAAGASRAWLTPAADADVTRIAQSFAQFNRAMSGDWAFDSTARTSVLDAQGQSREMPVLTFVRGEDLRTILVPQGDSAAAAILSLEAARVGNPRRVDAAGERAITDSAKRGTQLLIGMKAVREPFAVIVDYVEKQDANITRETLDIATERGITVEEIIRNHQSYDAYQESIEPSYIARNTTKLRFDIGGGAEALEATIAGDYFSDRTGRADWVWRDFYINGVKWKYGRIPELPLIQPEKVTQLPLDIHLTNEYRYELVRETDVLGYRTYEVRFAPPANAPEGLPLYRGTVWIDKSSWARVRISMVQLNLTGEVLSNEERVDFVPFAKDGATQLTASAVAGRDPKSVIWLPATVNAQQVISAAGRASVVQRETTFDGFRIDPPEFESLLAEVSGSNAVMVRETSAGLRYLEKRDGERVVKEGFDTSQLFLVGGIHHDDGLEYPVAPLGGVDYFNFNVGGRGIQTNIFFAGLVLAANATHPNVGNTRTNVGFDFFGIGIPTENAMYRDGEERPEEAIKMRPMGLFARVGHPFLQFGKIDVAFGAAHQAYERADDTASDFGVPSDTFIFSGGVEVRYARRGYTFSAFNFYSRRSEWEPWGNLAEYDPDQKSYFSFGASAGKSFFLPKFQRIGVDVSYLDGRRLDRFSKYELGFFGAQRVHGVKSGSVRAEQMILGHLSYGFVFSEQFRLEAFYDHAVLDDEIAGYDNEPFQGVGIAGQTIGPFGTLLRLDIGKTIGRNAQDGFVANVLFLKLF